ncbi:MAG: hypothetical protein IT245_08375 [Bacteroidia bacterium]|nr:hypothetical protein [Bacteroidia bacterium]
MKEVKYLYAKNLLTKANYEDAIKKGVNVFLFNEIDFLNEETEDVEFYNCTQNRVQSTWFSWEQNDKIIESFKLKCPQLFNLNGYDLTLSIKKAMFWANLKNGFLWYAHLDNFKDCKIAELEPLHKVNKIATLLRYAKLLVSKSKDVVLPQTSSSNKKIVIHIKNDFQVGLYQNLLDDISKNDNFHVLFDPNIDKNFINLFNLSSVSVLDPTVGMFAIPYVNFISFNSNDWYVFNTILLHWVEICHTLQIALSILKSNPSVLLINEGENGIYGALISEVMKSHNVTVFNTMNGIKSGEAQDAFFIFDKWFIWDNQMKDLLMKKNLLPESQLIVSGHLMEDFVKSYKYKNTLNIEPNVLKDKKVISLFSVRGKRLAKIETLEFLFKLIEEDDSYFLIIRPHPSEKKEDYFLPENQLKNYLFVEYGRHEIQDTLHDQLFLSDISIVFGSTVALDSKWMNVPCITYEIREEPLVYCVDNKWIFHVKSLDELKTKFNDVLTHEFESNELNTTKVSERIVNSLTQYAAQKSIIS